jgi:hypothetical protein
MRVLSTRGVTRAFGGKKTGSNELEAALLCSHRFWRPRR